MKKKILLVHLIFFSLIFFIGCEDRNTYRIQYKVTCDNETELTIIYSDYGCDEEVPFYGSEWQTDFELTLYEDWNDFSPYIYVKNNTDNDVSITAEIIIDGKLDASKTAKGPYAEINLEGHELDAPPEAGLF